MVSALLHAVLIPGPAPAADAGSGLLDIVADLDRVGAIIERDGIAAVPDHLLLTIAADAELYGVRPIATAVLVGHEDPDVARERAFSKVANGIVGARGRRLVAAGA